MTLPGFRAKLKGGHSDQMGGRGTYRVTCPAKEGLKKGKWFGQNRISSSETAPRPDTKLQINRE